MIYINRKLIKLHRQPLLILVICFILGIIFQDQMVCSELVVYWVAAMCIILFAFLYFHFYFLYKIKAFLLMFLFFGAGIILHFYNTFSSDNHSLVKRKETVVFKISQKLNSTEKYRKYEGIAKAGNTNFNSIFYITRDNKELDFIHYYKAEAYISRPKASPYDFQFDYSQYLKRRHIGYQIYISNKIISTKRSDLTLIDRLHQYRLTTLRKIDQSQFRLRPERF